MTWGISAGAGASAESTRRMRRSSPERRSVMASRVASAVGAATVDHGWPRLGRAPRLGARRHLGQGLARRRLGDRARARGRPPPSAGCPRGRPRIPATATGRARPSRRRSGRPGRGRRASPSPRSTIASIEQDGRVAGDGAEPVAPDVDEGLGQPLAIARQRRVQQLVRRPEQRVAQHGVRPADARPGRRWRRTLRHQGGRGDRRRLHGERSAEAEPRERPAGERHLDGRA